jgi:DNA-binding transcriptional LysR family regulator
MGKPPKPLRVALDAFQIDWRPLFHVLRLQKPSLRLEWRPIAFPTRDRPLLQNADVGVFADAPPEAGMSQLTIGIGPMLVLTAAGHCLARSTELWIADVPEPLGTPPSVRQRARVGIPLASPLCEMW